TGNIVIRLPLPPGCLLTLWKNDDGYVRSYLSRYPGYYLTADAGYKDADGYLWVMGRTDDIINVAGHPLSARAVGEGRGAPRGRGRASAARSRRLPMASSTACRPPSMIPRVSRRSRPRSRRRGIRGAEKAVILGALPLGVTGNTPDSGSGESWFEPRRGNSKRDATMSRVALRAVFRSASVLQAFTTSSPAISQLSDIGIDWSACPTPRALVCDALELGA